MNRIFMAALMISAGMCSEIIPHEQYVKIGFGGGFATKTKIQENSNKFLHSDVKLNRTYLINLIYGVNLKKYTYSNFRGEIEGIYSHSNFSGGKNVDNRPVRRRVTPANGDLKATVNTFGVFGNIYVDLLSSNSFVPFAGVGIGLVHTFVTGKFEETNNKLSSLGSDLGMGYQATVGISYRVNPNYSIDFSCRHINLNHPKVRIQKKAQYNNGAFLHKQNVLFVGFQSKL